MEWLAYAHPAGMLAVLAIGLLAAREGLRIRRARLARRASGTERHRWLGKLFVLLALAGFGTGLSSMLLLRPDPAFESVHAWIASLALACLVVAALLGRALERGASDRVRRIHLLCGASGLLAALGAAAAGMAILP